MYNIAICDDDKKIIDYIKKILLDYESFSKDKFLIHTFLTGEELLDFLKSNKVDLIYLDIELEELSGIDIGNHIRYDMLNDDIQIVYISAIKDYSMELFQIRPNNFLIKPLTKNRIIDSLEIALRLSKKKEKIFKVNISGKEVKQKLSDIIYFESSKHKVKMVTTNENIEFYSTMKELCNELLNSGFAMCHNSYLVNLEHIIEFSKEKIKMSDNTIINISRGKKDEFLEQIARFDLD